MTPKTPRKLRWKPITFKTECCTYYVYKSVFRAIRWCAIIAGEDHKVFKTKRQAVAACERHARNNPSKNS